MLRPIYSKLFFYSLSLATVLGVNSSYAERPEPPSTQNPHQPDSQHTGKGRGREEIALRDDDNRSFYQTRNRGNWDYRENWHADRLAYLSGMNQSQFDSRLTPQYGYGPYTYPANNPYYQNYSNNNPYSQSVITYTQPANTYYSNQYRGYAYQPSLPGTYYPSTYNTSSSYQVYPQYGYGYGTVPNYQSTYNNYGLNYPTGYSSSTITYPSDYGINTGYGANNYADMGYPRSYQNTYRQRPTYSNYSSSYYNTNQPSSALPYYNTQPSSSFGTYEFPSKTDMPYTPAPPSY